MKPRIYVDFNTAAKNECVIINARSLDAPRLAEGMEVILYDEELEVHARVEGRNEFGAWRALPDWHTMRDI